MGVDTRFITLYGIKRTYEECESLLEEDDGESSTLDFIVDGYDTQYVYLGHIFLKTASMRWDAPEGEISIDIDKLKEYKKKYTAEFRDSYPDYIHLLDGPWYIHSFVHYS